MAVGSNSYHQADHTDEYGGVTFVREQQTAVSTANYYLFNGGGVGRQGARVMGFKGIMTGAGAALDTVQLFAIDGDTATATAITEAIDLSALAEDDHFTCAVLEKTARRLAKQDYLRITTVSDAVCIVWVELMRYEETV